MEFLLELLLQIFGEVVFEGIWRLLGQPFRDRPHPLLATIAYGIFGAIFGFASVWLFPTGYLSTEFLRIGYLLLAPLAIGFLTLMLRDWLGRAKVTSDMAQFVMSAAFAFMFGLVRYGMIY